MALRSVLVTLSLALAATAAPSVNFGTWSTFQRMDQCLHGLPQHVRADCAQQLQLSPPALVPSVVKCLRRFISNETNIAAREQCLQREASVATIAAVAVHVQLMYESKCPDSIKFVKNQLAPTYTALGPELMVVDFIPYGIAKTASNSSGISFTCQHGPAECLGNKLQACGLARLGDNAKQVSLVNCAITSADPSKPDDKCFTDVGLDPKEVSACATGREGDVLLAGMGFRSLGRIPWVPRVTLNGDYTQKNQDDAEFNLLPTVCAKLPVSERPAACAQLSTTSAPSSSSTPKPVSTSTSAPAPLPQTVLVQIMYESLCPYSIQLIRDQLAPAFKALGPQLMIVDLVPYGKSNTTANGNGYKFTCQHGPNECIGNILQTCGLTRISDNKKQVEFVNCVMSSKDPSKPDDKCITDAGLSPSDMTACETGLEGQTLQAGTGFRTLPHIPFVPRITFNGVFDQKDQDDSQGNLLLVACRKLEPGVRPAACQASPPTSAPPSTSAPVSTSAPPSASSTTPPPKPSSSSSYRPALIGVLITLLPALWIQDQPN